MQVIITGIGDPDMQPGDLVILLLPVVWLFDLGCKFSLLPGKLSCQLPKGVERLVECPVRKEQEAIDSPITSND